MTSVAAPLTNCQPALSTLLTCLRNYDQGKVKGALFLWFRKCEKVEHHVCWIVVTCFLKFASISCLLLIKVIQCNGTKLMFLPSWQFRFLHLHNNWHCTPLQCQIIQTSHECSQDHDQSPLMTFFEMLPSSFDMSMHHSQKSCCTSITTSMLCCISQLPHKCVSLKTNCTPGKSPVDTHFWGCRLAVGLLFGGSYQPTHWMIVVVARTIQVPYCTYMYSIIFEF